MSLPPPARKRLEFAYDYLGRRIAKKVFVEEGGTGLQPVAWKLVKDLRFVYDGWNMIAELDHSFASDPGLTGSRVNRTFLWGEDLSGTMTGAGGVGGLLSTTYQGTTYHVCSDANGNVTGLVPTSGPQSGQLIARYDYDPFGNRITNTGPDVELCPIGFSSKYTDSETGLVYYGYRYYNPEQGRWLNRDPTGERGGINLYGMVGNDPVNMVDVDGRTGWGPNPNAPPGTNPITGSPLTPPSYFERRYPRLLAGVKAQYIKDIDSWVSKHCGKTKYGNPTRRFIVNPGYSDSPSHRKIEPYEPEMGTGNGTLHQTVIFDNHFGDSPQNWLEQRTPLGLGSFVMDISAPVTIKYTGGYGSSREFRWSTTLYVQNNSGEVTIGWTETRVREFQTQISSKGSCCSNE